MRSWPTAVPRVQAVVSDHQRLTTKYCGRVFPGHPDGWTCTVIGSRELEKERAADNVITAIYNRRVDSISKAIRRGSISRAQGEIELRLAVEKECAVCFDPPCVF